MPGERRTTAPHIEEGGEAVHSERRTRPCVKQHTKATRRRRRIGSIRASYYMSCRVVLDFHLILMGNNWCDYLLEYHVRRMPRVIGGRQSSVLMELNNNFIDVPSTYSSMIPPPCTQVARLLVDRGHGTLRTRG